MPVEKSVGKPGETYNNLTVIDEAQRRSGKRYVRCRCVCGGETVVRLSHLRSGQTKGCGCRVGSPTHRMTGSAEYRSWIHMKGRCLNPNDRAYPAYGGRGITVCSEWIDSFQSFYDHIGPKPSPNMSVDRVDNSGGYEPGNVRWATHTVQVRNTRQNRLLEHDGRSQSLGAWADELGLNPRTLETRLSRGWSVARSLTQPVATKRPKLGGLTAFGRHMSLPEWSEVSGIQFKTIAARVKNGWSAEDAVTIPAVRGSNQELRKAE